MRQKTGTTVPGAILIAAPAPGLAACGAHQPAGLTPAGVRITADPQVATAAIRFVAGDQPG